VLEELKAKMQEYLQMDTEIDFTEFNEYYQKVLSVLQNDFASLTQENLMTANGICRIVAANAEARGHKKDANSKKFKKIKEKTTFWSEALTYKLQKEYNMTNMAIEEELSKIWD